MAGLLYTGIAVLAAEIDHSHAGLVGLFLKIYALKERADKTVCVLADPGGFHQHRRAGSPNFYKLGTGPI